MKEGELNDKQADNCKQIGCELFENKPYPMCTVRYYIRNSGQHPKTARPKVIHTYKSQIPQNCTLEYDLA